jgi:initiation factor 1A
MPKNKTGGRNHRKNANKNNDDFKTNIRYSKDKDELYARVIKLFGNGMGDVLCSDNKTRLLQIRKKFRGRNKRDNVIMQDSLILVGIRSWEVLNEKKKEKADLLYVYSPNQYESLKEIPGIYKILPGNNNADNSGGGFEFTDKPTWLIKQEEEEEREILKELSEGGNSLKDISTNVISNNKFDWNLDDSDDMECFMNEI